MKPASLRTAHAFALIIAATLLALGGAMAWVHARFDATARMEAATRWLQERHQRALRVTGPVTLELLPAPALRLSDATLSESGTAAEFAHAAQLRLGMDLWALLRGQVRVTEIQARGLRLHLQRQADGRRNVDDLLDAAAAPRDGPPLPAVALDDLRVRIDDAVTGIRGEASLRQFTLARPRGERPAPAAFDLQLDLFRQGHSLLAGHTQGRAGLRLDGGRSLLALVDLSLDYQGTVGASTEVSTHLSSARVRHDLRTATTQVDQLRLASRGALAWLHAESTTWQARSVLLEPAASRLRSEGLSLKVRGQGPWQPLSAELAWTWVALEGEAVSSGATQATLRWSNAGRPPLTVHLTHAPAGGAAALGTLSHLRLAGVALRVSGGKAWPAGTGRADLLLDLRRATVALDGTQLDLRVPRGDAPALPLTLTGLLHAGPRTLHWGLDAALDGHAVSIQGDALWAGTVPEVRVRTRIDTLDLDALWPAFGRMAPPDHPERPPGPRPLDLSALRLWRGSLDLQARHLLWAGQQLGEVDLQASLEGGMLRVPLIEARLWGGLVSAQAFADARAHRITLHADAHGVHLQEPSTWLLGSALLHGRGRLSADLETAGQDLDELAARWTGKAAFVMARGRVAGLDTDAVSDVIDLRAAFGVREGVAFSDGVQGRLPDGRRITGSLAIDPLHRRAEGWLQEAGSARHEWKTGPPGPGRDGPPGAPLTDRLKGLLK